MAADPFAGAAQWASAPWRTTRVSSRYRPLRSKREQATASIQVRAAITGWNRARPASQSHHLFFAFICNALHVPVSAGVLYPAFGTLLPRLSSHVVQW